MRVLQEVGVGVTSAPVPRAPAPATASMPGGLLPGETYYVRIAWQGQSGASGAASDLSAVRVEHGFHLEVTAPADAPAGVTGAFVYAGVEESNLTRQNDSPVLPGATWSMAPGGLRSDLPTAAAQKPDRFVTNRNEWLRG
jgi:hypothetical protein